MQLWRRSKKTKAPNEAKTSTQTHARPHFHHVSLFVSASIFGLILIVWLAGIFFVQTATIGRKKIPLYSSDASFQKEINQQASSYRLSIEQPDKTVAQYSLREIGVTINAAKSSAAIKTASKDLQKRLLWWRSIQVPLVVSVDQSAYNTFIQDKAYKEITPVKNALLAVNPDGTLSTADESPGKALTLGDNSSNSVVLAVTMLDSRQLKLREQVVEPVITNKTVAEAKTKLEKTLSQNVTFKIDSKTVVADAHDIASWLTITPDDNAHTYNISVDENKVNDYVNKISAAAIRRPRNQVEVTHEDGSKVILVAGSDGLDVVNKSAVAKTLAEKIVGDEAIELTLEVKRTPFKTVATSAGNKLVEVDVTTKRMYAYENNVLVRTFLISAGASATPTVTGSYKIFSKVRKQDMRGSNADGSKYLQPDVEWVNYFYRDYAVHGNYWRPTSYFGNVNSSHGCVGIVNSDAEWFYNWAPIGTEIVVHT